MARRALWQTPAGSCVGGRLTSRCRMSQGSARSLGSRQSNLTGPAADTAGIDRKPAGGRRGGTYWTELSSSLSVKRRKRNCTWYSLLVYDDSVLMCCCLYTHRRNTVSGIFCSSLSKTNKEIKICNSSIKSRRDEARLLVPHSHWHRQPMIQSSPIILTV